MPRTHLSTNKGQPLPVIAVSFSLSGRKQPNLLATQDHHIGQAGAWPGFVLGA